MRKLSIFFLPAVFLGVIQSSSVLGQSRPRANSIQGEWEWAVYGKSKDELPPAYQDKKLKDVPAASLNLKLWQKGNKLNGEYSGTYRFLAKVEDGGFDTIINGNVAKLNLESGFGGTVTARITLRQDRLHWKIIKSEGEYYFPDRVVLHRVGQKRKRRV